jgi:Bax protein
MKLTSVQTKRLLKLSIVLLSLLTLSAVIYYFSAEEKQITPPKMTVQEKKARFKKLIIPAIENVYAKLTTKYQEVEKLIKSGSKTQKIEKLKIEYKVKTDQELLVALKPHPKSIAIAQAAMESSWATSRFFNEAYNIFGVWSFDKNEPRIAALQKRGDKTIWVKKYSTIDASVYDYYRTLSRGSAFKEFKQLNFQTDDPFALVKKLDRYSEKGAEYGHELTSIIKFNKFNAYD